MTRGCCCSSAAFQPALAPSRLDNVCIPPNSWDGSIHPTTLVKSSSSAWEEDSLVLTPPKEILPWAVRLGMVSG